MAAERSGRRGSDSPLRRRTLRLADRHPATRPDGEPLHESLARSFKKHQGETIGRFVAKVRVREAAHLLTHTDARIEEIAERTGFPNRAYLSRVFRRVTGRIARTISATARKLMGKRCSLP